MSDSKNLGKALTIGAIWMVLLRMLMRVIGIISTIILARLLSPTDFGLAAIAMSCFGLIEFIAKFGFDTALIQKQDVDQGHYDTAWTFNLGFGVFACVALLLAAPFIADFYDNQDLKAILYAVSSLFVLNGLQNVGVVNFRKNLTFNKEFTFNIVPKLISFFVTIALAFYLKNYWALIIGSIVWKGSLCATSFFMHSMRPRLSLVAWRDLFQFSKWLMINNFLHFINNKSPELLIGKILSPKAAGLFTIAQEIATLPSHELASNINRAAYPVYSKISSDLEQLRKMYLSVLESISSMVFPIGIGLVSVADVLIPVVLGDKWLAAIPLMKYLAFGAIFFALNSNTIYIYYSLGKPRIATIIACVRLCIFLPLLITLTQKYDLAGSTVAIMITTISMFFISNGCVAYALKSILFKLFAIHIRPSLAAAAMYVAVTSYLEYIAQLDFNNMIVLFSAILIGAMTYVSVIGLIWLMVGKPDGPEQKLITIVSNRLFKSS